MVKHHNIKVNLNLAIQRLKLLQTKKTSLRQTSRREISELLSRGKDESARIKVEQVIRDDYLVESMEILENYCELLVGRFPLLDQSKTCDFSLLEPVTTIMYAAPRVDVKELSHVRDGFIHKFGKEFLESVMENRLKSINPRLIRKLSVYAPDPYLVEQYLKEIAKFYEVPWESNRSFESINQDSLIDMGEPDELSTVTKADPSHPALIPSSKNTKKLETTGNNHSLSPSGQLFGEETSPDHKNVMKSSDRSARNTHDRILKPTGPVKTDPSYYSPPTYMDSQFDYQKDSSSMDFPSPSHSPPTSTSKPSTSDHHAPRTNVPNPSTSVLYVPDFDELAKRFEALKKKS